MFIAKRFTAIIVLSLFVVVMGSCGGGGSGIGGGTGESGNSGIINPVSTIGQIDAPSSISPSTLTVISGINSQPVNSDGSFSLDLNKDNTQLIAAVNPAGNPVLMSVIANVQEGIQINVDVLSTAIALIYLYPGVAQANPTDAQIVIDYIVSLSETTTLVNLLSSKLATNPDILVDPTGDADIKTAISNALSALITKVQTLGGLSLEAQSASLLGRINTQTISPSNASGLFLSFDNSTNTLSVENGGKRYVDLYVVSPDSGLLFTIGSVSVLEMGIQSYLTDMGFETESIGRTKKSAVIDVSSPSDVVIKAYGPGFYDFTNVWNNLTQSDKDRLISPVVQTGVYDIAVPIINGIVGVNLRICGEQSLITLTQDIMDNYTGAFLYTLETGSNEDFAVVVIGAVYDRLLANGSTIFKEILNECGFNLFDSSITILKAIFGVTPIVSGGEVLGAAATLSLAKAVETFTLSSPPLTSPWPMFQHDARHTGYSTDTTIVLPLNQVWTYTTQELIPSSPIVFNGTVYFGSTNGNIYAVDISSGQLSWLYNTGGVINSSPAVFNNRVYVVSESVQPDNGSYLYALDVNTGIFLWKFKIGNLGGGPLQSSPSILDGIVYVGSSENRLHAINADTGILVWETQLICESASVWALSSAAVTNDTVLIGTYSTGLCDNLWAFNKADGTKKWSSSIYTPYVFPAPSTADGIAYVRSGGAGWSGNLIALNVETGNELWNTYVGNSSGSGSPTIENNTVYIASTSTIYAFDASAGFKKWSVPALAAGSCSNAATIAYPYFAIANGMIFIKSNNSCDVAKVYAVSTTDGRLLWDSGNLGDNGASGGADRSTPTVANGHLFFAIGNTLYNYGP